MKRFLIFAVLIIGIATTAVAEQGDMAVGGQFNYATENPSYGLGAQFQIEAFNNVRLAPEFIYYFKQDGFTGSNANFNVHYLIHSYGGLVIYPMVGFAYYHLSSDFGDFHVPHEIYGANVGCGTEYPVNDRFKFYIEERYQILNHDASQCVTTMGIKLTF